MIKLTFPPTLLFFCRYLLWILCNEYQTARALARMKILATFGVHEPSDKVEAPESKSQAMYAEVQNGFMTTHPWVAAVLCKTTDPFTRNMRVTVVFCIITGGMVVTALFYGTDGETGWFQIFFVAVMSSIIIGPPTVIFALVFAKAGKVSEAYKREAAETGAPKWLTAVGNANKLGPAKNEFQPAEPKGEFQAAQGTDAAATGTMSATIGLANQGDIMRMEGEAMDLSKADQMAKTAASQKKLQKAYDFPYVASAYAGAWLYMLFCGYLIVLFGLKFEGKVANSWLVSSMMGMAQDMFVMQPVQIVGKGIKAFIFFGAIGAASGGLSSMFGPDEEHEDHFD